MKTMKYIFFVTTFASIYDRVLPLIEEKKEKGEVIIVASTEQIELFFKEYTDFKVIRTKVHPDLITMKTKYRILFNIIKSKNLIIFIFLRNKLHNIPKTRKS